MISSAESYNIKSYRPGRFALKLNKVSNFFFCRNLPGASQTLKSLTSTSCLKYSSLFTSPSTSVEYLFPHLHYQLSSVNASVHVNTMLPFVVGIRLTRIYSRAKWQVKNKMSRIYSCSQKRHGDPNVKFKKMAIKLSLS